jgi:DnaJ-domain-containing protein 1
MSWILLLETSSAQLQQIAEAEYNKQKLIEVILGFLITAIVMAWPTYLIFRYTYFRIKKEFRFKTKFNPYNHIDALVLLSMNVLRTNPECFKEKCIYLKEYIIYLYPKNNLSFHESLKLAYIDVYRSESIVSWLNRFNQDDERKDVVRFLIHMAAQDGIVASREKTELVRIIDAFGLDQQEWLVLMDGINEAFTKRQRFRSASGRSENSHDVLITRALEYFGIKREGIDEDQLRLKYRQLVKKFHPDSHPDLPQVEKKELELKFQELQMYYEELLKLMV